jgi:hypothetical protein
MDPRAHMIPTTQQWTKIAYDLQKMVNVQMMQNGKMCKDKWNRLNSYYKKILNYHKGTCHNNFF